MKYEKRGGDHSFTISPWIEKKKTKDIKFDLIHIISIASNTLKNHFDLSTDV